MIRVKYEVRLFCPKKILDSMIPADDLKDLFNAYNPESYDYSGSIDDYVTADFDSFEIAQEFEYKLLQLFENYMVWEDNESCDNSFVSMP